MVLLLWGIIYILKETGFYLVDWGLELGSLNSHVIENLSHEEPV